VRQQIDVAGIADARKRDLPGLVVLLGLVGLGKGDRRRYGAEREVIAVP
jgi:hypothetical protein